MALFRNHYECPRCDETWEDEWSCACNDECPSCGLSDIEPTESQDVEPATGRPSCLLLPTAEQIDEVDADAENGDRFFITDHVYAQVQIEQDGSLSIHDFKVAETSRRQGFGRSAVRTLRAEFDRIRANGVEMDQVGGAFWLQMQREGLITSIAAVGA